MVREPSIRRAIWRGLCKRCPRCGRGRLFDGWYRLREQCEDCGLAIPDSTPDHIGLMYLTTAVQTASFAFIVLMVEPPRPWLARSLLAVVALAVMLANIPNRKGFAIAVDYLVDRGDPDAEE